MSFPTNCFRHPRQKRHSCREQSSRSAQLLGDEQSRRVKQKRAGQLREKRKKTLQRKKKSASEDKILMSLKLLESSLLDILFTKVSYWEKSAGTATRKKLELSSYLFPLRMEQFVQRQREIYVLTQKINQALILKYC